jgi:hypothetical protein
MKKLTNLVLGLGFSFLSAPIFSQNMLPERLRDYQYKTKPKAVLPFLEENNLLCPFSYDIDSDGWTDVWELYSVNLDSTNPIGSGKPYIYLFDLNNDNQFDEREFFYDKQRDGFNGNEEPFLKPEEMRISRRREVEL